MAVEQEIEINCGHVMHIFRDRIVLVQKHENGVPANHSQPESRNLEVDLSKIKYNVPQHHKKMG